MTPAEFKGLVRNVKRIRITPNVWQLASGPVERMHIELDTWLFIMDDGRGLYECDGGLVGRPQVSDYEFNLDNIALTTEAERVVARTCVRGRLKRWLKRQDVRELELQQILREGK